MDGTDVRPSPLVVLAEFFGHVSSAESIAHAKSKSDRGAGTPLSTRARVRG